MKKPLNVIVSGLGRIAWKYHIPHIMAHEGFRLLAVADPMMERLDEATAMWPGIRAYSSFHEMCDVETSADMAVIASPTLFHKEQTLVAFQHGLGVFLEKPMCANLSDAQILADTSRAIGCKLMLYQPHRTRGEFITLNSTIRDKLGTIFHCRRVVSMFDRRNDWQSRTSCGGGMLNNYGAHFIDQFLAAFGSPLSVRGASMKHIVGIGDAEDFVNIMMQAPSGVTCSLEISLCNPDFEDSWTIFGSLGKATWNLTDEKGRIKTVRPEMLKKLELQKTQAADGRAYSQEGQIPWLEEEVSTRDFPQTDYYNHIHAYFSEGATPFVPLEETMEVMRVMEECRRLAGI